MLLLLVAPDKYGLVRVQELATRTMCGGHDPGGYATGARELGRVLAPLIDWLLFADRMSAQSHALNAVAATVAAAPRFWGRIASATDALVGDPSLAAAAVALPAVGSGLSPLDHWTGVLGAVARFCTLCLERFPGTPVPGPDRDALLRVAASIADHPLAPAAAGPAWAGATRARAALPPTGVQERALAAAVAPLAGILDVIARRVASAAEAAALEAAIDRRRRMYPPLAAGPAPAAAASAPGGVGDATAGATGPGGYPGGARHDNDQEEVADIAVFPTADEMLCEAPPYLPFPPATEGTSAAETPGRLLERLFRLTREDLVAPLREAIQAFRASAVAAGGWVPNAPGRRAGSGRAVAAPKDLHVYRGARIDGVTMGRSDGARARVAFDPPAGARGGGARAAARYWEAATRRLGVGTLVCLCRDLHTPTPLLLFGVIVERDVDASLRRGSLNAPTVGAFTGPSVHVAPCGLGLGEWLSAVAACPADTGGSAAPASELLLLHAPQVAFFAAAPVLRALARLEPHLPFRDILAASPGTCAPPRPPAYLLDAPAAGRVLDLNALVDDPARRSPTLAAVDVLAPGADGWPSAELLHRTSLDEAQVGALRAALSTSVVLLQGPPGTGKSFLSVRLVQLLVQRHQRLRAARAMRGRESAARGGGILVVSYTNHALDQFLLGLMDRGIDGLVRLGRRSEHPRLEACSLQKRVLAVGRPGYMRYEHAVNRDNLKRLNDSLNEAVGRLQTAHQERERVDAGECASWHALSPFLDEEYPAMFNSLVAGSAPADGPAIATEEGDGDVEAGEHGAPGQDDGKSDREWTVVSRKRSLSRAQLFHSWQRGGDELHPDGNVDGDLERLSRAANAWSLPVPSRRQLVRHWVRRMVAAAETDVSACAADIDEKVAVQRRVGDESTLAVLRSASVVGATTTKAADIQSLIATWAPQVVVIEEAAEVLEAHCFAALHGNVQQLILVGDHKQLRPKYNVYDLALDSGRGYNLDVSLFERLADVSRYNNVHQLLTQRRMRPAIADLIRDTVYPSLADAPCVRDYPDEVRGMGACVYFWEHDVAEDGCCREDDGAGGRSHRNTHEVGLVVALTRYLIQQGYHARNLVVLTGYAGQLALLRAALSTLTGVAIDERDQEALEDPDAAAAGGATTSGEMATAPDRGKDDLVRLATVDNYQGEESDVVIVSLVRCNPGGVVGFLSTPNRINVLLSRAKHGLFLVGSARTLTLRRRTPGGVMWSRVVELLRAGGRVGPALPLQCQLHGTATAVRDASAFAVLAGDGGCAAACGFLLSCGHTCPRRCHPDDRRHVREAAVCRADCMRLRPVAECAGQHPCPRRCGEACGPCRVVLPRVNLPCGHTRHGVECVDASRGRVRCITRVAVEMPLCGHTCEVACAVAAERPFHTSPAYCTEACGQPLPCGHPCAAPCKECRAVGVDDPERRVAVSHGPCRVACGRAGACGHDCNHPCHAGTPCPPCDRPCARGCEHAACALSCGEPCVPCLQPCSWACPHAPVRDAGPAAGTAVVVGPAGWRCCVMPCGAPCDMVPCDRRCGLPLLCGHPCPSLCGEPCPSSAYCAECGDRFRALADEVVDLLTLTHLADVDVDADPVIVLACGHLFLRSTLDGWFELPTAYVHDEVTGRYIEPAPLPAEAAAVKGCPTCRQPVAVRRYGRPAAKARLDAAVEYHIRATTRRHNALLTRLNTLLDAVTAAEAAPAAAGTATTADRRPPPAHAAGAAPDAGGPAAAVAAATDTRCRDCALHGAAAELERLADAANRLADEAEKDNPAARIHTASLVTVEREAPRRRPSTPTRRSSSGSPPPPPALPPCGCACRRGWGACP